MARHALSRVLTVHRGARLAPVSVLRPGVTPDTRRSAIGLVTVVVSVTGVMRLSGVAHMVSIILPSVPNVGRGCP